MTPSANHDPPKAGTSARRQGPEEVFDEFVSFIRRFCTEKSFKDLKALVLDYDTLQKKLGDTKAAYDKNLEELTRLVADRNTEKQRFEKKIEEQTKQHSKVLEDKAAAYLKLKAAQDATTARNETIKLLEENIKNFIVTHKRDEELNIKLNNTIKEQNEQLGVLKKETAMLKSELQSKIEDLDKQSKDLTTAESKIATFQSYTATLTQLQDVRVDISKTFASSFEDASSLFREFLGRDVEEALDTLPAVNPFQDTLVRAVLLEVLPDQQRTHRDTCAERVVEEVLTAVAGWVLADQLTTFKSRLSRLTSLLCVNWQRVQRLHERVEPCFVFETPDDWQPLPTWIDPVPSDSSATAAPRRQENREPQPRQKELKPAALSTSDIVEVVWPAFLANSLEQPTDEEGGTSDLIYHGFVLTRAEVQGAADEEMPRRAMRRAIRTSNTVAQKKRRDSAVFLSPGASDGLDVK
ncbi:hypothetical protein CPLU01_15583 [Colletotrichum plurivorum]|uniref:Uncharacterized protein n=1 Tax=Colletotrichum plurivorum TaxID=2175906 RepID=A0A8H6J9D0_9PEZI|nr:hypothetical protein CPLU01_15583 [Colletotrichum plurivorum]